MLEKEKQEPISNEPVYCTRCGKMLYNPRAPILPPSCNCNLSFKFTKEGIINLKNS